MPAKAVIANKFLLNFIHDLFANVSRVRKEIIFVSNVNEKKVIISNTLQRFHECGSNCL